MSFRESALDAFSKLKRALEGSSPSQSPYEIFLDDPERRVRVQFADSDNIPIMLIRWPGMPHVAKFHFDQNIKGWVDPEAGLRYSIQSLTDLCGGTVPNRAFHTAGSKTN